MPIRPELRHYYTGPEWEAARKTILERAGHCCEQCKVPNHALILRLDDYPGWWVRDDNGAAYDSRGEYQGSIRNSELPEFRLVTIVLTVAHLNHDPSDNRDENLKALCQWCHLNYDKEHHKESRSIRKDASRPLLEGMEVNG